MTASGPTDTKAAAFKIILGEIGPLFDRMEAIAKVVQETHPLIEADVTALGTLVHRLEKSLSDTCDHASYMIEEAKVTRQTPAAAPEQAAPVASAGNGGSWFVATVAVICAVVCIAASAGALMFFNAKTFDEARIGRAVNKAMKYVDPATKQKLEQAIQKSAAE